MKQRFVLIVAIGLALLTAAPAVAGDAGDYFQYLEALYNRFDKSLRDYLISELEQYLAIYPTSEKADRVLYLLGRTYDDAGDDDQALAVYTKLAILYPGSDGRGGALEAMRAILARDKTYKDQRERLEALVDEGATAGSRADRSYAYLQLLTKLNARALHQRLLDESVAFKRAYPLDPRLSHLDLWVAVSWANRGESDEAAQAFQKFEALYPNDPSLPYARFTRAELLTHEMRQHAQAATLLKALVAKYPEDKYAPQALYLLGEIEAERLKDYRAGIADYRRLIDDYPGDERAPKALLAVAALQEKQLGDVPAAVATLKSFPERFPGDTGGVDALEHAAELQSRRLQSYGEAAGTYASAADYYPQDARGADMLMAAGKLLEEKTDDLQGAFDYYQQILKRYPGHRRQAEVAKRIQKLRDRQGG